MNKALTSREAILAAGKESIRESGEQALSIRDVARRCGIAIGSVYNYFPSKGDLIVATVESIWLEIMQDSKCVQPSEDFTEHLRFLFECIQKGTKKYPSFLNMHSMSFTNVDKTKGKMAMQQYFRHIKEELLEALLQDTKLRMDTFSEEFTISAFVDFTFSNILMLLMNEEPSCEYLLQIIKRTIY